MKTSDTPFPQTPCPECLASPKSCIETDHGGLVVHCNHKDVGGVWSGTTKQWMCLSPIDADTFAKAVLSDVMKQHGFEMTPIKLN